MNHSNVDVLVIGAGPTGLGAAKRLNQIVRSPLTASYHPDTNFCLRMALLGWSLIQMRRQVVLPLQMSPRKASYVLAILLAGRVANSLSYTTLAAMLSSPTTNISMTALMRHYLRRTIGLPTNVCLMCGARNYGFRTHSRTTSPCCQRMNKSSALMAWSMLPSSRAQQPRSLKTLMNGSLEPWEPVSAISSCDHIITKFGLSQLPK